MKNCLTKPILFKEVSCCLVDEPACEFAHSFGFSFLCRHPEHEKFHAHLAGGLTHDEISERYNALKRKRREAFLADLSEEHRNYFCSRADFHGHPIAEPD